MYFIGTEECERSIAQSAINPSKKNWENYLIEAMGDRYVPIRSHTLQAIHLMAFAHKSVAHMCSLVTSAAVATGAGNTMGNKGGVAVYLKFGDLTILVVNAHLAAHQNAEKQRNNDFHKINRGIPLLLDKKSATFRESTRLAPIAEDKPTIRTDGIASIADGSATESSSNGNNNNTATTSSSSNKRLPLIPPRSIDVSAEPTFGLALITTPAMRQESVQMIGKEVDGNGPLSPIENPLPATVAVGQEGEEQLQQQQQVVEEPQVIVGAAAGSLNGPREVILTPSLSSVRDDAGGGGAAVGVGLAVEDPGDEDDGDEPDEGANTVEDGLACASVNTDTNSNLASVSVEGGKTPRLRSTSTEVLAEMGLSSAESRTLDQSADVVIFMGDLNYRIKGNRAIVSRSLEANMHEVLLNNDQLRYCL